MGDHEAVPGALALSAELQDLYESLRDISDGALATYIPPLADADPSLFGLAIVTVDGHCYSAGDTATAFTIQSVSKPFVFGLALDDLGVDTLLTRVGVEPTGDAFNSITVDEASGRPFNPMVNAGAIVTTSLLGATTEERDLRLLDGLGRFAGRTLDVDEVVFDAERVTGDRNRAIAYLMRTFGMLRDDVDTAVESYFRQCSVLVDVLRPRGDGRDARQRRRQPSHRRAGPRARARAAGAQRDEPVRDVRLRGRVAVPHRAPGEERGVGWRRCRASRRARDRLVLASARRTWQQRAGHSGVRGAGAALSPARVRRKAVGAGCTPRLRRLGGFVEARPPETARRCAPRVRSTVEGDGAPGSAALRLGGGLQPRLRRRVRRRFPSRARPVASHFDRSGRTPGDQCHGAGSRGSDDGGDRRSSGRVGGGRRHRDVSLARPRIGTMRRRDPRAPRYRSGERHISVGGSGALRRSERRGARAHRGA